MMQMHDWSLTVAPDLALEGPLDASLRLHLRIEQHRHRVSHALMTETPRPAGRASSQERLALYKLLNASLQELEGVAQDHSRITPNETLLQDTEVANGC